MIETSFDGSDDRVVTVLKSKGVEIFDVLAPKMDALMFRLQGHIQNEKLEGQVLAHRTGKLSASIRVETAHVEGGQLVAAVTGGGGVAPYGFVHEFGGTFDVPEYTRRVGYDAKGRVTSLLTRAGAITRKTKTVTKGVVRAHTVTFAERSFMRSSQEEMRAQIEEEIAEVIQRKIAE